MSAPTAFLLRSNYEHMTEFSKYLFLCDSKKNCFSTTHSDLIFLNYHATLVAQ